MWKKTKTSQKKRKQKQRRMFITCQTTSWHSIMLKVTWRRFDQSAKQLVVGRTTTEADNQSSLHCVIVSTDVIPDHIGCRDASHVVDAQIYQRTQANLDRLRWFVAYCRLPLYDVEKEVQHCWALAAMGAVWVAGSLKSGALNYEVGCRWDQCSWIWPTLDSSILQLSSIESRLMCGGWLHWHPMKYQRVSWSGCSCCLASLHYMTYVPCIKGSGLKWHHFRTGQGPYLANLHQRGLAQSPSCDCGQQQTVNYSVCTH